MISPADDEEEEIIIKRNALTADLLAGSHFDKCSTRSISTSRSYYGQSAVLELFVRNQAKISLEFTDKSFILDDLSVSKTHFTDKRPFLTILSVIAIFGAGHLRTEDSFSAMCP